MEPKRSASSRYLGTIVLIIVCITIGYLMHGNTSPVRVSSTTTAPVANTPPPPPPPAKPTPLTPAQIAQAKLEAHKEKVREAQAAAAAKRAQLKAEREQAAEQQAQEAAAEAAQPKWHKVLEVQGDGEKNTDTFTVGSNWEIEWNTKPGEMEGNFQVDAKSTSGGDDLSVANVMGTSHDHSMEYTPGTYYLSINADQPYDIVVSDYH